MIGSRVAKRYARALLDLAVEQNQLEPWGAELSRLADIVGAPEVAAALDSPELPKAARLAAAAKIAERLELSFPLRSFAVVLARHGRLAEIAAVAHSYQELLDLHLGRARAVLTFATPPSDAEVTRVTEALERACGKKVLATVKVDGALLGGLVAELEGRTYDASLANRLGVLERRLGE